MRYAGLVAALGNPGPKYTGTRHNMGFIFADFLFEQAKHEGNIEKLNGKKFISELWRVNMPGLAGEWLIAKPLTFMNDSGKAVQPLLSWYELSPEQLVVIQDEMDLPAGSLRFKFGGGLAGHKGLTSISRHLGTDNYNRLRIGIGKPEHRENTLAWVLGRPDEQDRNKIRLIMPFALNTLCIFSRDGLDRAVQYAHAALREAEKQN